jgi:hypothetical protein
MCVTNYLLHRYASVDALPGDDPNRPDALPFTVDMYERARALDRRTAGATQLSTSDLWSAIDEVAVPIDVPGARTLWQTLFDLEDRTMTVRFYLGDDGHRVQRSDPVTISVGCANLTE